MTEGRRTLITLTTDFGLSDGYVGVMKGVMLGLNPDVAIVDLSHDIPPQGIADAAYVLRRSYQFFPLGSIHVVVVDPEVGTERRAIALSTPEATFVAPDNGVLTYVLEDARAGGQETRAIHLLNRDYWLPQVSSVFHGRDIFAPVAAHLSLGVSLDQLGPWIEDLVTLPPPHLERQAEKIVGQVMHIDHFGNVLTNISAADLESLGEAATIQVGLWQIDGISSAFAEGEYGKPIAYVDSSGHLALALVDGSAHERLGCQIGELVEVSVHGRKRAYHGEPHD
jgi:S-adenosylmethionine hydrolase